MFRFEGLEIWKLAVEYSRKINDAVDSFPQKAQYNLGSQLRSAVIFISNNIAEGSGSDSKAEFRNFLNYSIRSTFETVSMLFISRDSGYITEESFKKLYSEGELLVKKITSFRKTI